VAAAAYRAGALLIDERSGQTHHYLNRKGVVDAFILLPENAPEFLNDRSSLWNAAEQAENRKNSRTARELVLALPHELSSETRRALTADMAGWLTERYGVAVDSAIHEPIASNGDDHRNHHAHMLFTTREVTSDGLGKKTLILDNLQSGPKETEVIREVWETLLNDALTKAGFEDAIVDRRTLEEQGIDRTPQIHIGKKSIAAQEAEEREHQEEDDEDTDSDTDTESGKSGKGDSLPPSMEAEGAEDTIDKQSSSKRMREVYDATDTGWRADLVEEIKDLNMRRAVFDDRPLDEQIIHLERLMEKLDSKAEKLSKLKDKASISSQVKELLKQLVDFATRDKSDIKLVYKNKEAKHLRKISQMRRYGRKYREGIHSQMQRMEKYIEIVSQKQKDYAAYKSFVKELEQRLEVETLHKQGTDSHSLSASKIISTEEVNRKLHLRSAFIKEHFKEEGILDQSAKLRNADNNDTPRPEKQNPAKQIESEAGSKSVSLNSRQKQQDKAQSSNKYYVPPSENMRSFAQEIDAHIEADRKRKGFAPFRKAGEEGLKSSFNYRDEPTKFTTTAESHRKRKETAEKMREKVPPEYRAEPYSDDELNAERERKANKQSSHQAKEGTFKNFTEGFKSKWEDVMKAAKGDDADGAPKKKRRAKMSGQFNQASGAEDRAQGTSYEYYDGFDFDL
jgi:hypothetical protein